MGQTLEMLLADPDKVKDVPTGTMEIKRLTEKYGKPFVITFKAGTLEQLKEIGNNAVVNGKYDETEEIKWTVYELCTDPNFKDERLRKAFGVARPVDVVEKILLGGELTALHQAIIRLSGMGNVANEIKN